MHTPGSCSTSMSGASVGPGWEYNTIGSREVSLRLLLQIGITRGTLRGGTFLSRVVTLGVLLIQVGTDAARQAAVEVVADHVKKVDIQIKGTRVETHTYMTQSSSTGSGVRGGVVRTHVWVVIFAPNRADDF